MTLWVWLIPLLTWLVGIPTTLFLQWLGRRIWPPKVPARYITESEQFKSGGKYPENLQNIVSSNKSIEVETYRVGTQIVIVIDPSVITLQPDKGTKEATKIKPRDIG